jgi:hypothetical protein
MVCLTMKDLYQVCVRPEWNTGSKFPELRGDDEALQRHEQERGEGQKVDRTRVLSKILTVLICNKANRILRIRQP